MLNINSIYTNARFTSNDALRLYRIKIMLHNYRPRAVILITNSKSVVVRRIIFRVSRVFEFSCNRGIWTTRCELTDHAIRPLQKTLTLRKQLRTY